MFNYNRPVSHNRGPLVSSSDVKEKIKAFDKYAKDGGHTPLQKTQSSTSLNRPPTQTFSSEHDPFSRRSKNLSQWKSEMHLRDEPSLSTNNPYQTLNSQNGDGILQSSNMANRMQQSAAESFSWTRNEQLKPNVKPNRSHQASLQNTAFLLTGSTEGGVQQVAGSDGNGENELSNIETRIAPGRSKPNFGSMSCIPQNSIERMGNYSSNRKNANSLQGTSKEVVERRRSNSTCSFTQPDDSTSQQDGRMPIPYAPTYCKSTIKTSRPKSIAVFPTVEEQTDDTLVHYGTSFPEVPERSQIDGNARPSAMQHYREMSKSDTRMDRKFYIPEETTSPNIGKISDSSIIIGGVHHTSTGALSGVSVNSSQYNERKYIIDTTRETLEEFVKDINQLDPDGRNSVTELRRYRDAKAILDQTGLLFIKCAEKDGSTYLGYGLLNQYSQSTKCILGNPSEYTTCITGGEESSYTVMVDDAFGGAQTDCRIVNKWRIQIERSASRRKRGALKIIFILKNKNAPYCRELLRRYERSVIDFSEATHQLSNGEKLLILERCIARKRSQQKKRKISIPDNTKRAISETAVSLGFLGMVELFLSSNSNVEQGERFFAKPSVEFYKEIDQLRTSEDETHKDMYLALATVYLFNGTISKDDIAVLARKTYFDQTQGRKNARSSVDLLNCSRASRKKAKYDVQPMIQIESYTLLVDLASLMECSTNLGKRISNAVKSLKDNLLHEIRNNCTFLYPSVEVAISVSIGHVFPEASISHCSKTTFHSYVGTDMTFSDKEDRCMRLDLGNKDLCMAAFDRLRQALKDEDCRYFVSHPLMRDARFWEIVSENCDGQHLYDRIKSIFRSKKTFVEVLMGTRERITQSPVLVLSLEYPFVEQTSTQDCRSLADWAIKHSKWEQFRKENTKCATEVERAVIEQCCKENWEDVYMSLVDRVNMEALIRNTCLFEAVKSGSLNMVNDILSISRFTNEDYRKALKDAMSCYTKETTATRRTILVNLSREANVTELLTSLCRTGDANSLIAALTVFGKDINRIETHDGLLTFILIECNHWALFRVVTDQLSADQRIKFRGQMSIHKAAELGRQRILGFLLDIDPDLVHEKNAHGRTPLHLAAYKGHVGCVLLLLEKGARVDEKDHSGQTALHKAAWLVDAQITHILLWKGADIYIKDKQRETAIDVARHSKHEKVVQKLLGGRRNVSLAYDNFDGLGNLFKER